MRQAEPAPSSTYWQGEWFAFLPRGTELVKNKIKVLVKLFQKLVVSKGKAFGRAPQSSKYLALFSLYPQSSVENLLVKKKDAFFHILHRKLWKIKGLSRGQSARREQGRLLKFSQALCQNCKIVPSPILGENKMLYNKKKLFVQKGRAGG